MPRPNKKKEYHFKKWDKVKIRVSDDKKGVRQAYENKENHFIYALRLYPRT